MKVLLINKYFYKKGGAELVFFDTAELLKKNGHELSFFSMHHPKNEPSDDSAYFVRQTDYDKTTAGGALRASANLLYSVEARRNLDRLLDKNKPDIAHLHNIYHQLSPSILHTLKKRGIPVVMTLHDYKMVCASYSMLANGLICEACSGGRHINCFTKACVKGSKVKSLLNTAEMYLHHNLLKIYGAVDRFISPSLFLKQKMWVMGFKAKIEYLPNFVDTERFCPSGERAEERTIIYFGRLSKEKGVATLMDAVSGLDVTLKIIGDGPLREELVRKASDRCQANVRFLGYRSGDALQKQIHSGAAVVVPSEWYENNPKSVLEAFALGKPVIGSRIGGIPELVHDAETGFLFRMGDTADLREKIMQTVNDPQLLIKMSHNARSLAESLYGAKPHYERLMGIYESVLKK